MRIPGLSSKADDADWAKQLADRVTQAIDAVHDAAVVPLTTIVRAIVFGVLAGIVGISALVLSSIAAVRLLDVYLDNIPGFPEGVWLAHFVMGAIFILAAAFLWTKRAAHDD